MATTDAGGGAITDTIFVGKAEDSEFAPPLRVMAVKWLQMGGVQCLASHINSTNTNQCAVCLPPWHTPAPCVQVCVRAYVRPSFMLKCEESK